MRFRVLGPLEVLDASGNPVVVAGTKERTLLAALLINPGDVVSTDRLIDILWPAQPPGNPGNALQARISALRRSLRDHATIATLSPGYRLEVTPDEVDVTRFERLLAEARQAGAETVALDLYDRALALWRGEPFADFSYRDFARPEILRLEEMLVSAHEGRIQVMLDMGRHREVLAELESLVLKYPLQERFRAQLMVALYRSGRQADALRAYAEASRILGEELGIEPSAELRDLEEAILVQDPAIAGPPASTPGRGHNLPARITSLIGRSGDVSRVVDLLGEHRLLTLTGPGGVGKTSLALACGQELLVSFNDGVWLVELAAISDPALVAVEIARSLGLEISDRPTLDLVCEVVAERVLLLVIDNCEHLVDAAAEAIVAILHRAPGVRVIATSREPLGVPGEILWPTRPLAIPTEAAALEDVEAYDAVRLFVERVRSVDPEFDLDTETAPAVADICRRLDGLPLALELAASRARSLPVAEIAARLDDRFRLLTTGTRTVLPRQMTLEATISWSYDLLPDEERDLLRRVSVFSGGWTVEAAEAIAPHPEEVLDLLSRLVDRSLVTMDRSAATSRFSMLETVKEFAARELAASGDQAETILRHAEWCLGLAESATFLGPNQARWEADLSAEYENLRTALLRSIDTGEAAIALRLGTALGWWWFFGNRDEGRALLNQVLEATDGSRHPARVASLLARARLDLFGPTQPSIAHQALELAERLEDVQGAARAKVFVALGEMVGPDTKRSMQILGEAIDVFGAAGDAWEEAFARFQKMEVLAHGGNLHTAIQEGERAMGLFRTTGDPWAISAVLAHLAKLGRFTGQLEWAGQMAAEALDVARERGLPHTVQYVLTHQAYLALLANDAETAQCLLEEAMPIAADVGNRVGLAAIHNGLAECHVARGELREAIQLHTEALHRFEGLGLAADTSYSLTRLGLATELAGDGDTAWAHHREGMRQASDIGDVIDLVPCLEGLGRCFASRGEVEAAVRIFAAGSMLRDRTGLAPLPEEAAANRKADRTVATALPPERREALWAELQSLETPALVSIVEQPVA